MHWDDKNDRLKRFLSRHSFRFTAIMISLTIHRALFVLTANDVAVRQRQCYGDEITSVIRTCRKRRWNRQEDKRIQQEIDLQVYLHRLIDEEKKRQIEMLNIPSEEPTTHADAEALSKQATEIERYHAEKKGELDRLFSDIDDRRKRRDVPDYLCGKISFELMRDPVITPSGITYDRRDIDEHLRSKRVENLIRLIENKMLVCLVTEFSVIFQELAILIR